MDKQVKSILKRTAAAALSAAMVLTMGLGAVPSVVYAGDLSGAEARNESREVKIDLSEIASMSAKTYGPQGDGDTLEASFDGDTTTYTNSNYNDPANGKPQVYTFNFADTVDLCKVRIHPRNSGGAVGNGAPNSCTVEVSTDGVQYTQVAQSAVTDTSLTWTDIAFAAVPASSVRLTLDSAHENVVTTGEVELYKLVSEPSGADKTELDTAISTIAAKMEGLDKADYVTATWEALETALSAAQAVSEDPNATEEQVAGALADLQAADTGLSVLVSPVYMTDFVSYENGRVTVELNGPTDYIPDGSTKWTYEYKDGRHLLYTDDWDNNALTSGETENYREVCIYDLNKKNPEWSYIYIDEDGNGTIAGTSYNAEKPKGTLIAGGKEYDISNSGDLEEIEGLKFTATPVVTLKGINLSDISRQRTGVGEDAVDVEVTDPTRTSVEIPLVNQKGSAASGNYQIFANWADGKTALYYNIKIDSVNIIDRSALEEVIEIAEALTESDYTPDSWAAMQEKLAAAKDVLGDCIATKTEVADAAEQLNTAVADLAAAPQVDKSELQALYDEVKDAAFTYPDNSYYEKFTTALTNAADILENQEADQETVDSAHDNLERFYWLNMVNDKVAYYNFNKQGEDGRFVYDDRPTESILPVVAAFLEGRNSSASWTTERLVNCYNRFVEAEKLIQEPTPDALGVQVGLNVDAADADNPGYFEITGEEAVEENGKTMIKVSFDFVNDGIDSVTGKDIGAYSLSTMKKANFRVRYTRPEGGSVTKFVSDDSLDSLDGSWSKGVTGEVTVEPGSTVNLEMYYNSDDTFMPGYYKVISPAPEADKSKLQELYEEASAAEFKYPDATLTKYFIDALTDAKAVLDAADATQEEVDSAYYYLEKHYWQNVIEDKVAYYNPTKNGEDGRFDYSDKVTQSILPLLSAYQQTHNVNNNTEMDKLSSYYEIWEEAEKCTPETADEDMRGVEVGINTSADGFDTKDALSSGNTGHFEITGQEFTADSTGKVSVKVTFQFINDGLNPVTGAEADEYSLSEMNKASCRVTYESPSGKGSKGVTVTDRSKSSLTGEFTVDQDSVISLSLEDSTMLGFFKVQKFTSADKTELEKVIAEAAETIAQEYNYIKNDNWDALIASYEKAEEIYNDPFAGQDEVNAASLELVGRLAFVTYETTPPEAVFVVNGSEQEITENALIGEDFDLKFTDNGRLYQFLLNGREFEITGTEDTAAFSEIESALNEGNGEDGKNILTVRDSVPPLSDIYLTEVTYTFYFDQTAPETEVSYSTTELTNGDVTVKVTSNEALDEGAVPEGWTLSDDGMTLTKTYESNAEENITVKDLAGNAVEVSIKVDNIVTPADKTELEKVIAEAAETIAQEYNYIKNDNWDALIASYEKAEEIYNDPFAGQDEVNAASLELVGRLAFVTYETTPPEAVFVVNGSEQEITENVLIGEDFDLKFTDNGRLYQFLLNGREFEITGTEDTAAFSEIESALNEGNGEDGKNILTVRDSVPPLFDIYLTEVTYTFYFDQTAPETEVSYSTTELTNGDVTVTVTSNEALDAGAVPEGWTLSDDGMTLTKTYESNAEENITVKDLAGNESEVSVAIANIDKTPLTLGTPEYIENEDGSVTVQIKVDSDIDLTKLPEGWTYADGSVTKTFEKSAEESVTLYDEAGNVSSATVKVTISDKTDEQKPGDDGKKPGSDEGKPSDSQKPTGDKDTAKTAVKTGDESSPVIWAVVLIAACAAAAAVIVVRKKRK